MNSNYSTIVVFDKRNGKNKTLVVKTKHVNRVKIYIAAIIVLFVTIITMLSFVMMENKKAENEKLALAREIKQLHGAIPLLVDTIQAKNYIQNIERKLISINKYLRKRGVKGFTTKSVGGGGDNDAFDLSAKEMYQFYDDHLDKIISGLAYTPVGYPSNVVVSSSFGYRNDPFHSTRADFHSGIDFRGRHGENVKSTAFGKVIKAGWYAGYGNCVIIQHQNGYETLYGHLSKINVKVGEEINVDQVIGNVGSTGHSTGSHLHYEVRKNNKPINPVSFLNIY